LGLEAVQGEVENMIEFSFDIGNLLLKEEEVKAEVREVMRGQSMLRETGWTVTVKDGAVDQTGGRGVLPIRLRLAILKSPVARRRVCGTL